MVRRLAAFGKDCGLGWNTLKGKKAEERRLASTCRDIRSTPVSCEKEASRHGQSVNRQATTNNRPVSINHGAEVQRTGPIRRPQMTEPR
jgi:hypothetical protein